jgi:hypothetical protein
MTMRTLAIAAAAAVLASGTLTGSAQSYYDHGPYHRYGWHPHYGGPHRTSTITSAALPPSLPVVTRPLPVVTRRGPPAT